LDLGPVDAGWTLLAADEEAWRLDARTEGGRVDLRVDGRPVESARLPVDVPVPPGGWRHVHVELFGPDGDLVAREEVGVLRLPAHLAREGPRAARAADGSLLLLVPPPAARSYARPDLRVGNNNEYFDKLSRLSLDLARGPKPLAHPYLLGRCEVSAGQFRARFPDHEAARGAPPDHPVAWVTREDADDYARAFGLALPTLVEWMWAARGGDERPWPWGHGAPADLPANFGAAAVPVDSLPEGAGRWGHLHLAGNVHEWVAVEADEGDGLLARCLAMGGSWTQGRRRPTSATDLRLDVRPGSRHDAVGFRLVWRPDP
ncbi:MAG: SUMF1/EgtB/PvdO family nonheme iron enzyme, partial [Planctomycetota bacterium]|nr:SUMF1/EgtB/PvdO family nonheme iron enzyme [Planctomycetota bacterium]